MHRHLQSQRSGLSVLLVGMLVLASALAAACGGDESTPSDGAPAPTSAASESTDSTASLPTYDASNPPTSTPATPVSAGSGTPLEGSAGGSGATAAVPDLSALPQELQQAVTQTREAETVEYSMNIEMTGVPELPGGTAFTADGAIDAAEGRMRMRIDMSAIFGAATPPAGTETDELTEELLAALGDGVMEMVVADGVAYMRWPLISAFAGVDTEWVGVEIPAGQDPLATGDLSGLAFADPAAVLDSLGGAGSLEATGAEEIRGIATTRYDGQIDLQAALMTLSPEQRADLEAQLGGADLPTMPVSLWVGDDDGLLRRVQIEMDFADFVPAGTAGVPGSMLLTMEYFNFGGDVDIEAPPADQVTIVDDGALLGGLGGSFGGPAY